MKAASKKQPFEVAAAEYRLKLVETELSMASTLCRLAQTLARYNPPDEAIKVLHKVRDHVEVISFHIDVPHHLPPPAISALRGRVVELNKRIEEIESSFYQELSPS